MGKTFGNLKRLTGVTYYVLSPHEVKPFTGMLNPGIQNTIRRFSESFFYVTFPLGGAYLVYDWAKKEHHRLHRKNPDEFKNDV